MRLYKSVSASSGSKNGVTVPSPLKIGPMAIRNNVFLAPMSGITDLPFRKLAHRLGAGLVISEMIASEQLARHRPDILKKSKSDAFFPAVVQLSGREAYWMAEGAKVAVGLGADIIDINMGCPAKQVTRGLSGSALMRDEDHALELIEAVVQAVTVPVTLKMRLGWDDEQRNAPSIARKAEAAGVQLITVHGRTRCQFFKGQADWKSISRVKKSVSIPVIANGDITRLDLLHDVLDQSGADGIMIGRGCCGAPWLPGRVAHFLKTGWDRGVPGSRELMTLVREHYDAMLSYYGTETGGRNARKHLGWYIEQTVQNTSEIKTWRGRLCRELEPSRVDRLITQYFEAQLELAA